MRKLLKALKGYHNILFLDFEGTQFSHEMIAFGAIFVSIDKNGRVKKKKEPIKYYVKAKNQVGKFVENLTGISDFDLRRYGITFADALVKIKKYCGINFKKTIFMTFGNHDMRILTQSASYTLNADRDILNLIKKNYVDFQAFISEFIKDENNNPLSLSHYLEVFGVEFDGQVHDPKYDAVNLEVLFEEFMKNKEVVLSEYNKVLANKNNLPDPIGKVVKKLASGQGVTAEEFQDYLREYIK